MWWLSRRFGVVVDVGGSSSTYDVRQFVQFGSGAVHLVVLKSVLATDVKVACLSVSLLNSVNINATS